MITRPGMGPVLRFICCQIVCKSLLHGMVVAAISLAPHWYQAASVTFWRLTLAGPILYNLQGTYLYKFLFVFRRRIHVK